MRVDVTCQTLDIWSHFVKEVGRYNCPLPFYFTAFNFWGQDQNVVSTLGSRIKQNNATLSKLFYLNLNLFNGSRSKNHYQRAPSNYCEIIYFILALSLCEAPDWVIMVDRFGSLTLGYCSTLDVQLNTSSPELQRKCSTFNSSSILVASISKVAHPLHDSHWPVRTKHQPPYLEVLFFTCFDFFFRLHLKKKRKILWNDVQNTVPHYLLQYFWMFLPIYNSIIRVRWEMSRTFCFLFVFSSSRHLSM